MRHVDECRVDDENLGFTLFEVLVVLAIMSLTAASVTLVGFNTLRSPSLPSITRSVAALATEAGVSARVNAVAVALEVDARAKTISILGSSQPAIRLDDKTGLQFTTGRELTQNSDAGRIVFYPTGGASGGMITMTRPDGASASVRVNWLTGAVRVVLDQ